MEQDAGSDHTPTTQSRLVVKAFIFVLIFGALIVVFAVVEAYPFIKKNFFIKENTPNEVAALPDYNNQQLNAVNAPTATSSNHATDILFYQTEYDEGSVTYLLYRGSMDYLAGDAQTHSISLQRDSRIISQSWEENTFLFVENTENEGSIFSLDISSDQTQPTLLMKISLDATTGQHIGDARYLDDGTLAYITYDGSGERARHSVLHVAQLPQGIEKENYPLREESPVYAGFGFLAQRGDSQVIYLHETGGDAGSVWSAWYMVDRTTKAVTALEGLPVEDKVSRNPAEFSFSPDGSKFIFKDISKLPDAQDLEDEDGPLGSCLKYWDSDAMDRYDNEGGTLTLVDLVSGSRSEIFRNLSHSNNVCKNIARRIISIGWIDDSHVFFETIDGIFSLDINTREQKNLFIFERTYDPKNQQRPSVIALQAPNILLSDHSVASSDTNKILQFVSEDAQEGIFVNFLR